MINVKKEGILLKKTELEFENEGVLNPAAIREGILFIFFTEQSGKVTTLLLAIVI